jgi:hypothetical protein
MHDNFVIACGGKLSTPLRHKIGAPLKRGIGKTFAEIREKHPNAFRPWSKEQDEELKKLFTKGLKVSELMKSFGRKRGGITARLEKLGLVEK